MVVILAGIIYWILGVIVSRPQQICFQKQRNASCEIVYVGINEGTYLSVWKWLKQFKLYSEAPIFCRTHNMTGLLFPNTCFQTSEMPPRKVSHHQHIVVFICSSPFSELTLKFCCSGEGIKSFGFKTGGIQSLHRL